MAMSRIPARGVVRRLTRAVLACALGVIAHAAPAQSPAEAQPDAAAAEFAAKSAGEIAGYLNRFKPDPAMRKRAQEALTRQPPETTDPLERAKFYIARSQAAGRLGDIQRQLADLRTAAEIARPEKGYDRGRDVYLKALHELSIAERLGGNFANALRAQQEFRDLSINTYTLGRQFMATADIARLYTTLGDLTAAREALSQAENMLSTLKRRPRPWAMNGERWEESYIRATGFTLLTEGRYAEAESALRDSLQRWSRIDNPFNDSSVADASGRGEIWHEVQDNVESRLIVALVRQGKLAEAEFHARAVLARAIRSTGRYSHSAAKAMRVLGGVFLEQGRYADARTLAEVSIASFEGAGVTPLNAQLADARRMLATTMLAEEKWPEAVRVYEELRASLAADRLLSRSFAHGDPHWALALLKTGRTQAALAMINRIVAGRTERFGAARYETAEAMGVQAMALAQSGDRERARAVFAQAVAVLTAKSETELSPFESLMVRHIVGAYIDLLIGLRQEQTDAARRSEFVAEAFRLADFVRGRSVQRAVGASAVRSAAHDPDLARLVREEQDTRQQIDALQEVLSKMYSVPAEQQLPDVIKATQSRIDDLEKSLPRLKKKIVADFPQFDSLVNLHPATIEQVRAALLPGEALASILSTGTHTYVWAVPKEGDVGFAASSLTGKDVAKIVAELRRSLDPGPVGLAAIPEFNLREGYRLYAETLKPVEATWGKAANLIVITGGALGQLPLSLLPTEPPATAPATKSGGARGPLFANYRNVRWLITRLAVTHIPSTYSLITLRAAAPSAAKLAFAGFGDPEFGGEIVASAPVRTRGVVHLRNLVVARAEANPEAPPAEETNAIPDSIYAQLPPLPDTEDEILAIADALHADRNRDVYLHGRASRAQVLSTDLTNRRIIAFATHGLIPGDLPGLTEPALALSRPADHKGSGLLTLDDVLGMKLDADWVVLSACNTAAGNGAGAEAISGLGRAFFYAGSRALLVTHWPVETVSARMLVSGVFQRYGSVPNMTRAQALRLAMLDILNGPGNVDPATHQTINTYAHPIFWAPYALVGDGGR